MATALTWIRLRDYLHQHDLAPGTELYDEQGRGVREFTLEDDGSIRCYVNYQPVPETFSRLAEFAAARAVPGGTPLYLTRPGLLVPVIRVSHQDGDDTDGDRRLILHREDPHA